MSRRNLLVAWLLTVALPALAGAQGITIPNTFVNGTAADANQVNANFTALANDALNRTGGTMTGTLNSLTILPTVDNTSTLGDATHRFSTLWVEGTTQFHDLTYTWPASQTANYVLSTNGSGALSWVIKETPVNDVVNGRLTLTTVTPVTNADVTAATTLYWSPYRGNYITLYDGSTTWTKVAFTELSIAVPATTTTMYDVFVYNNGGTAALELLAWTNDTTRATALVLQNGVLVKSGVTTRRYVGSFRTTTVAGQTEDSLAKRYVWNYYNRTARLLRAVDTTDSWTYNTATFRQARASTANQVEAIVGYQEVMVNLTLQSLYTLANANFAQIGIGEDSTTVPTAASSIGGAVTTVANGAVTTANLVKLPVVGYHYYAWLEKGDGVSVTWFGDDGQATATSGLAGWIEG